MSQELWKLGEQYAGAPLDPDACDPDPIAEFRRWFQVAVDAQLPTVNAMTLATADAEGRPSARIVLLKGADARGFVFYTNYESRKAQELAANPRAALLFYWIELEREVRRGVCARPHAEWLRRLVGHPSALGR